MNIPRALASVAITLLGAGIINACVVFTYGLFAGMPFWDSLEDLLSLHSIGFTLVLMVTAIGPIYSMLSDRAERRGRGE